MENSLGTQEFGVYETPQTQQVKPPESGKKVKKEKCFCDLPWKETVVKWNGTVLPCCAVFEDKFSYGDAFEKRFKEVWNDRKYLAARKELLGKENEGGTVCHICKAHGFTHF